MHALTGAEILRPQWLRVGWWLNGDLGDCMEITNSVLVDRPVPVAVAPACPGRAASIALVERGHAPSAGSRQVDTNISVFGGQFLVAVMLERPIYRVASL